MRSATTPDYALEAHWLCMSTKLNINVSEFEHLLGKCPESLTLIDTNNTMPPATHER